MQTYVRVVDAHAWDGQKWYRLTKRAGEWVAKLNKHGKPISYRDCKNRKGILLYVDCKAMKLAINGQVVAIQPLRCDGDRIAFLKWCVSGQCDKFLLGNTSFHVYSFPR